jgi:hypothetical protein
MGKEAAEDGFWCVGHAMQYELKFVGSLNQTIRVLNVEAENDDSAIECTCRQSIYFRHDAELWQAGRLVSRLTPMTARLYLPDDAMSLGAAQRQRALEALGRST